MKDNLTRRGFIQTAAAGSAALACMSADRGPAVLAAETELQLQKLVGLSARHGSAVLATGLVHVEEHRGDLERDVERLDVVDHHRLSTRHPADHATLEDGEQTDPTQHAGGEAQQQVTDVVPRAGILQAEQKTLLVENFGDAPFSAERLEPVTIASMGIIAAQVRSATSLPLGVNALRNDARAALGIAVAAEASFIRVNVHTGVAATDQGMVEGRADETLRLRQRLNPDVGIFADVHVKHAAPISQPDLVLAAEETAYRGMADAVIPSTS